jgi:hypothetical protein
MIRSSVLNPRILYSGRDAARVGAWVPMVARVSAMRPYKKQPNGTHLHPEAEAIEDEVARDGVVAVEGITTAGVVVVLPFRS